LGMKRSIGMVAVMTAALTALAGPQTQPQSQSQTNATQEAVARQESATIQKPAERKVEIFTPFSKKSPSIQTDRIERVDGMSSQPWLRMVGPQPGWSAFTEPERRDAAAFDVIWIGAPPLH
jgi:hypothetical protein